MTQPLNQDTTPPVDVEAWWAATAKVTQERDAALTEVADCKALASAVIERLTTERDGLLVEVERQLAGRGMEQMMLRNALPELAALDRVRALCSDAEDRRDWINVANLRAAIEGTL
jgi:hypothetical protein